MKIDKEKFLFMYQNQFKPLNESQLAGLEFLLERIEADETISDYRWAAYMLATVKWEVGETWQPISEHLGANRPKYSLPDKVTGQCYAGRGFIQLTWKGNYQAMSQVTGLDLVNHPELALNAGTAYKIMSWGMVHGSFTGVRLATYINGDRCDFIYARKVINGLDKAVIIADYAQKIADILKEVAV